MRVLRPLLMLAYEREYLDKDPRRWVQKRREERPDDIDPFSFGALMAVLTALPDAKWVRYSTVALGTGLRPSEHYTLRWEHIDCAGKRIQIQYGMVRGHPTLVKAKGSRRNVDMLPMVEAALREHMRPEADSMCSPTCAADRSFSKGCTGASGGLRSSGQGSGTTTTTRPVIRLPRSC
ncbi:MAG TPA: hypothetical protein VIH59_22750 [Candidatus Tectomicrobia bacterium]